MRVPLAEPWFASDGGAARHQAESRERIGQELYAFISDRPQLDPSSSRAGLLYLVSIHDWVAA
jgi:hypothetical protein